MSKCLVCGKELDEQVIRDGGTKTGAGVAIVNPQQGTRQLHEGKWYYFCGTDCRSTFMNTPEKYIHAV